MFIEEIDKKLCGDSEAYVNKAELNPVIENSMVFISNLGDTIKRTI